MSQKMSCVGCEEIRVRGGGFWHNNEPHFVGCQTELAELRSQLSRRDFARCLIQEAKDYFRKYGRIADVADADELISAVNEKLSGNR